MLQVGEQIRGSKDRALLASFALPDVDPPSVKVQIADVQSCQFKSPDAGVSQRLDDTSVPESVRGMDNLQQFCFGEVEFRGFLLPFSGHMPYFPLSGA